MKTDCIAEGAIFSDLNRKKIQGRGDVCIHVLDPLCCMAETNMTLLSSYTPVKNIYVCMYVYIFPRYQTGVKR